MLLLFRSTAQPPCLTSFPVAAQACLLMQADPTVNARYGGGSSCFYLRHQPTWASSRLVRAWPCLSSVLLSVCLYSQNALGFFLSLFHADIYSCNCAGRMKIKQCLPPLSPSVASCFPFPQGPVADRVQKHKAKSISSPGALFSL